MKNNTAKMNVPFETEALDAYPDADHSVLNLYQCSPLPGLPLFDKMKAWDKSYAVMSCGKISEGATTTIASAMTKMAESGKFVFRGFSAMDDVISSLVTSTHVAGPKELYKPYESFGGEHDSITLPDPTYDAHAIAAFVFNLTATELKIPVRNEVSAKRKEIEGSNLSPSEKSVELRKLMHIPKTGGYATFESLKPTRRAVLAAYVHTFLGKECTEPVEFIVISTPDGAKTIKEVFSNTATDQADKSNYAMFHIGFAEFFDIPLYNVQLEDDQVALFKHITGK